MFCFTTVNFLAGGVARASPGDLLQGWVRFDTISCPGRGGVYGDVVEAKDAELLLLGLVCKMDAWLKGSAEYLVNLNTRI